MLYCTGRWNMCYIVLAHETWVRGLPVCETQTYWQTKFSVLAQVNCAYWQNLSDILLVTGKQVLTYWHKWSVHTGRSSIVFSVVLANDSLIDGTDRKPVSNRTGMREGIFGGVATCAGWFIMSITDRLSLWRYGHDSLKTDTSVFYACMHSTHTRHQSIVERLHRVAGQFQPYN